jgi:D-amino-acid dehydrogenase
MASVPESISPNVPVKEVIILGGGIIGLSVAANLALRGVQVRVVDRNPARRDGCSFGNAGMIVPSHFIPLAAPGMVKLGLKWMWNPESPFYIKPRLSWELLSWAFKFWQASTPRHVAACAPLLRDLNLASRELYVAMAAKGSEFGLVEKGLLMLCKTQLTLDEEGHTAAKANQLGVPAQVLNAAQTAALDPAVTMDVVGSVYFPKDCHLRPEQYLEALERTVLEHGGSLHFDTAVTGWRIEGSRIRAATTNKGEISGDSFVLAGGSWSPEMLHGLPLRIPMQAGKGYSLTVANPVELPQLCSILTEARVAVTPMGSGLRFGGTMEIAGLNEDINPRRISGIVKAAPQYFPNFRPEHFAGIQPWRGLRPCSPDGMPYLGKTAAAENLIVATGHSMMGLSLAPITGEIAADLATDVPPKFDLRLLSPDRFA